MCENSALTVTQAMRMFVLVTPYYHQDAEPPFQVCKTSRGSPSLCTTLPQVLLVDIVFTPFPTQRAVAMATIGSATARLADIGPLAMT